METSELSLLIFGTTVAYFITAKLSRRPGKQSARLQAVSYIFAVLILVLTAHYFYKRFTG